jgi:hypothetical protein
VALSVSSRRVAGFALAAVAGVFALSGCGGTADQSATIDSAPIVIQEAVPSEVTQGVEFAFDPRADLDIDDQYGDGQSVVIDAIRVTRDDIYIVILDEDGTLLGSAPVPPGIQIVQVDLDIPITRSGYYYGQLVLHSGDGAIDMNVDLPLVDDDREIVYEDFEYYLW